MDFAEIEIEVELAVPPEQVAKHVQINVDLGRPFLLDNKYDLRDEPLAIVAGGPSLKSTIKELRDFKYVMTCGTAHDHVVRQGIKPSFAIYCDCVAGESDLASFQLKQPDCQYLISTNVDPVMAEHLSDCPVLFWDAEDSVNVSVIKGRKQIRGGSTAATRAPALGMVLGFTEFHLFGVDSCFEDNRERHAYDYADERLSAPAITAKINGRKFQTSLQFLQQARDFQTLLTHYGHTFTMEVHGDSLMRDACLDAQEKLGAFWRTRQALNREKAA